MQSKDIIEGNKLIWSFMGGKWQPTENAGKNGMRSYESKHDTFEDCQKACNEINGLKSGSPRIIVYAVPSIATNKIDREIKYHSSWDWLMPVWKKLGSIMYQARDTLNKEEYGNANVLTIHILKSFQKVDIDAAFGFIVEGVKWYNSQTPQP